MSQQIKSPEKETKNKGERKKDSSTPAKAVADPKLVKPFFFNENKMFPEQWFTRSNVFSMDLFMSQVSLELRKWKYQNQDLFPNKHKKIEAKFSGSHQKSQDRDKGHLLGDQHIR